MRVVGEQGVQTGAMTEKRTKSELKNTRFLVSVWYPASGSTDTKHFETLSGIVWEADPRDPGRISTPENFVGLSALPNILGGFLTTHKHANPTDTGGEEQ